MAKAQPKPITTPQGFCSTPPLSPTPGCRNSLSPSPALLSAARRPLLRRSRAGWAGREAQWRDKAGDAGEEEPLPPSLYGSSVTPLPPSHIRPVWARSTDLVPGRPDQLGVRIRWWRDRIRCMQGQGRGHEGRGGQWRRRLRHRGGGRGRSGVPPAVGEAGGRRSSNGKDGASGKRRRRQRGQWIGSAGLFMDFSFFFLID